MNIYSFGFYNIKLNNLNFTQENSINFKGNSCEQDSFDLSDEAQAKALISKLKQENKELLAKEEELLQEIEENSNVKNRSNATCKEFYSLNNELTRTRRKIKENDQIIGSLESSPNFLVIYGDPKGFQKATQAQKLKLAKQHGLILDLNAPEYAHIMTSKTKRALTHKLEQFKMQNGTIVYNNNANKEYLSQFDSYNVIEEEELCEEYRINPEELSSECKKLKVGLKYLILIPRNETTDKILADVINKKVATQESLGIPKCILPWTYEKYCDADESSVLNYRFIKLDDENNQRLIESSRFRSLVQTLPFHYNEMGLIDMSDARNQELLQNANPLFPTRSKYAFNALCDDSPKKINIPTEELERLGFSRSALLIDLINNGKLDGEQNENGEYFVTIDTKNRLGKNKNLDLLYSLRKQDPRIKTFKEVSIGLSITQKRLEYAIFSGEVEIIKEYINAGDKEVRYINITTPKNQEFIRKIRFEQEFERQLKETQREARKQAKIDKKDIKSRLQGVRMALVWEFMPNTREIGSMLAKEDGYVAKLLAKEDDPNETLTHKEEVKINSYRKEVWMRAGTEELHQAHKKANAIMELFKEQGIGAIAEEYHPIFERYGFIK